MCRLYAVIIIKKSHGKYFSWFNLNIEIHTTLLFTLFSILPNIHVLSSYQLAISMCFQVKQSACASQFHKSHCPSNGNIPPLWTEQYCKAMEPENINRLGVLSTRKQSYPHFSSVVGAWIKFINSCVAQVKAISDIISPFVQGSKKNGHIISLKCKTLDV